MKTSDIAKFVVAAAGLFWIAPAQAYLDPATGSILLQGLLAGIAGIVVVVRLYWRRLKGLVKKLFVRS